MCLSLFLFVVVVVMELGSCDDTPVDVTDDVSAVYCGTFFFYKCGGIILTTSDKAVVDLAIMVVVFLGFCNDTHATVVVFCCNKETALLLQFLDVVISTESHIV